MEAFGTKPNAAGPFGTGFFFGVDWKDLGDKEAGRQGDRENRYTWQ